jgi:hypothetical protein
METIGVSENLNENYTKRTIINLKANLVPCLFYDEPDITEAY